MKRQVLDVSRLLGTEDSSSDTLSDSVSDSQVPQKKKVLLTDDWSKGMLANLVKNKQASANQHRVHLDEKFCTYENKARNDSYVPGELIDCEGAKAPVHRP
mmetsp:Transcript_5339/g.8231  ORF Transcript_5339/g.8231 Transcript_5339/m.8231 type:complete len:101 (-) Transcript_5339:333-635(-)